MLKAQELNLAILQSTVFTPNVSAFTSSKALAIILSKYAQRYDGNVQALPLPEDIPPDVPRVVLQSQDGSYRLEIAPTRITSFWVRSSEAQAEPEDAVDICSEVLKYYIQSMGIEVNRLALVVTRIHQSDKPAALLIERFCKPELLNTVFQSSENFEIHNHSIRKVKDFTVNAWTRCKSGFVAVNNNQPHSAVIVEQDLNTPGEGIELRKFSVEEVKSFFCIMPSEAQAILQLYFPNN